MKTYNNPNRTRRSSGIEPLERRAYCAVDLSATISFVSPPTDQVKPGHAYAVAIEVTNTGDTAAKGMLSTDLGLSANADGSSPLLGVTLKKHINLAPGGQVIIRASEKIPLTFAPGAYYAAVTVDPDNTFADADLSNNFAVTSSPLDIPSLYPDVEGTYVGSGVIKKGVDKGLTFTQSVTNTSEDLITGIVQFSGTDLFSNDVILSFSGQTTVKPNGTYIANGSDVPADASVYVQDHGTFVGDVSKGTFKTAINSGTFNDVREA